VAYRGTVPGRYLRSAADDSSPSSLAKELCAAPALPRTPSLASRYSDERAPGLLTQRVTDAGEAQGPRKR
jgi:hypothetical protein